MGSTLVNLVKLVVMAGGTGTIAVGAAVPGYRGVEALSNSTQYSYTIQQGAEFEVGTCVFLASGNQLVRTPEESSNGNAPITVLVGSLVSFVARAEDFEQYVGAVDVLEGELIALPGAGKIGLSHSVVYPTATEGEKANRSILATDHPFNARPGDPDSSSNIQAAIDYALTHGGGKVRIPAGNYACKETVGPTLTSQIPITIEGDNYATVLFRPTGGSPSTDPIFSMDATGILDSYAELKDIAFQGNNIAEAGLRATNIARFLLKRVSAFECTTGIDGVGALIFETNYCRTNDCHTGFKTRAGAKTANLIRIVGHEARECKIGYDFADGEAISMYDSEGAANGDGTDPTTANIVLRSTLGNEAGEGTVRILNSYGENNQLGIYVENAANLMLVLEEPGFLSSASGHCMKFAAGAKIRSCYVRNSKSAGASDIVQIRAVNSVIIGGLDHLYDDQSDFQTWLGVTTSAEDHAIKTTDLFGISAAGHEMLFIDDFRASGLSANDAVFGKYGTGLMRFRFFSDGTMPLALAPGNMIGMNGSAPVAKGNITGSRGGNAAVAALLTYFASRGDITDGTTP